MVEITPGHTQKNVKYGVIFFCITTFIQVMTSMFYIYNSNIDRKEQASQSQQNRKEQAKQSQLNRQFEILKTKYYDQDKKNKEIQFPIFDVRDNLLDISNICSKTLNPEKLKNLEIKKSELKKNRIILHKSIGGIQIIFSSKVYSLLTKFTSDVEKVVTTGGGNNCPSYLPPPSHWLKQFRDINSMMLKETNQTKQELDKNLNDNLINEYGEINFSNESKYSIVR